PFHLPFTGRFQAIHPRRQGRGLRWAAHNISTRDAKKKVERFCRLTGGRKKTRPTPGLVVGDTGIEPVTSSVSGKRAPAAPIA
ncbi:hypothetical protein QP168_10545, partial [Aerococcus urinae]|nr:hypothetical protein [Aerococcus urinae]